MRVGFNAAELKKSDVLQCGMHLIQNAIFFDAPSTVGDQYPGICRNFLFDLCDLSFAEMDPGRVPKTEVIHLSGFLLM